MGAIDADDAFEERQHRALPPSIRDALFVAEKDEPRRRGKERQKQEAIHPSLVVRGEDVRLALRGLSLEMDAEQRAENHPHRRARDTAQDRTRVCGRFWCSHSARYTGAQRCRTRRGRRRECIPRYAESIGVSGVSPPQAPPGPAPGCDGARRAQARASRSRRAAC